VKPVIQLLYRIRRALIARLGLKTRGVKVMVFNPAGELLLIRNSYGRRHLFVLPGGGIGRRESPDEAARREVREETALAAERLEPRSVHLSRAEGRIDTIHLFTAVADGVPKPCRVEVEEARFFPLDALPETVSAATRRRIAEYRGERPVSERW
jgi:8-oxo-dGTP pyrophosphatase MutT (NUDIX family)